MTLYKGSCHCAAVKFEAELDDVESLLNCNCSICKRAGWKLTFVSAAQFKLLQGDAQLQDYQFGKKNTHHTFCKVCGVRAFSSGASPEGEISYAVNVNCLEDFEVKGIAVQDFDGASL